MFQPKVILIQLQEDLRTEKKKDIIGLKNFSHLIQSSDWVYILTRLSKQQSV